MNATTATSSSNNQRLRVAVAGASGRMGRMLIEAIAQSDDLALAAALDRADSPSLGTDPSAFLGQPSGIAIESDVRAALSKADCLIDFTRPEGTMDHLAICAELGVKLVIGTTGFSDEEKARIAEYAQRTAVVLSRSPPAARPGAAPARPANACSWCAGRAPPRHAATGRAGPARTAGARPAARPRP